MLRILFRLFFSIEPVLAFAGGGRESVKIIAGGHKPESKSRFEKLVGRDENYKPESKSRIEKPDGKIGNNKPESTSRLEKPVGRIDNKVKQKKHWAKKRQK